MERVIVQAAEKGKKEKANFVKELADREEIFKTEKNGIEKKYGAEIEKYKSEIRKR